MSSIWAMGCRPGVADWGGGISVVLHRGSSCSRAEDGRIMHCGLISSCQSDCKALLVLLMYAVLFQVPRPLALPLYTDLCV